MWAGTTPLQRHLDAEEAFSVLDGEVGLALQNGTEVLGDHPHG